MLKPERRGWESREGAPLSAPVTVHCPPWECCREEEEEREERRGGGGEEEEQEEELARPV